MMTITYIYICIYTKQDSRVHHRRVIAASQTGQRCAAVRQLHALGSLGAHLLVGGHDARTQFLVGGPLGHQVTLDALQLLLQTFALALQQQLLGAHLDGVDEPLMLLLQAGAQVLAVKPQQNRHV